MLSTLAFVSALVALFTVRWSRDNYRKYVGLGKSGLPRNVFGWAIATTVSLAARGSDVLSIEIYTKDRNPDRWLRPDAIAVITDQHDNLATIPRREGTRPQISWHVIPHRQISDLPSEYIQEVCLNVCSSLLRTYRAPQVLAQMMKDISNANTSLVSVETSPHERLGDALVINPAIPSPDTSQDCGKRLARNRTYSCGQGPFPACRLVSNGLCNRLVIAH
jgi:hypothetical protein